MLKIIKLKKELLKIKENEEKQPKLFNKKSLGGFTRLLILGSDDQLLRAKEIYEQHKSQNKEIKSLSIRQLNDDARAQNRRKRTIKKVQIIANKNAKRTNEENERTTANAELPQMEEQEEETKFTKKGLNSFAEGNVPDNIQQDIDKSIYFLLIHLRKFIKDNEKHRPYKLTIAIVVYFTHIPTGVKFGLWIRTSDARKVITATNENDIINHFGFDLRAKIGTKVNEMPSGLTFNSIKHYEFSSFKMSNNRGGSYIETPNKILNSRCGLINIKNDDNNCFYWCLLYHQIKTDNARRIERLKNMIDKNKYNFDNICYPVSFEDINIFEQNNINTHINVFKYNEEIDEVNPIRISNNKGYDIINLLLLSDDNKEHYIYIKNIDHLYKNKNNHNKFLCSTCFKQFSPERFEKHDCSIQESTEFIRDIKYPELGTKMELSSTIYKNKLSPPFIVFCDFECILRKTNDKNLIQKHIINAFGCKVICTFDDALSEPIYIYQGEDAGKQYIEYIINKQKQCNNIIQKLRYKYKYHNLTNDEEKHFKQQYKCYLCNIETKDLNRDHCHLTGKYRGALCFECNINYNDIKRKKGFNVSYESELVVIFHNGKNYDFHFILQEASAYTNKIDVISQSFEKYSKIEFNNIRFIDSFNFMAESLENLTNNLKTEYNIIEDYYYVDYSNFKYTFEEFKINTPLICKKGIYPYDYIDNIDKFKEGLPAIEQFYNKLKNENINNDQYEHVKEVYKTFNCKTLKDYHDLYLKSDVLFLTDICENFRKICNNNFNIDAFNYQSSPGMAWNAMQLITKQPLGLVYDDEKRLFLESSNRGGITMVGAIRQMKANNKYCKNYNKDIESNYISYVDANNLYGGSMSDFLPYNLLDWCDKSIEDIINTPDNSDIGYYVEFDMDIPNNLHDYFNDYPPCPEIRTVPTEWLSDYQKDILKLNKSNHAQSSKLLLTLYNKQKYICHYRYLKIIHSLGCKIVKIYRTLAFEQSQWLKPYIDLNTKLRKQAHNEFEKDFFKLMINSVFGKTMENVLKYESFEIVKDDRLLQKRVDKDNFKNAVYINNMWFISASKEKVLYNKPYYIGCAILDLSKVYMLDFHYNYMKVNYLNCNLLYTDTDSLVYNIKTDDLYKDMYDNKDKFDLSNSKIIKYNNIENEKTILKFKDETKFIPITDWVALCPKSYSYITDDGKDARKGKGVTKNILKQEISHKDYENILNTNKDIYKPMIMIKSKHHQLYTISMNKKALCSFDDKIYRISANEGHPYGYNPI